MKRKLLAILTAVCMTATFVGGSATIWAAQEESAAKDEVIVTMPRHQNRKQVLTRHTDGEQENMYMSL